MKYIIDAPSNLYKIDGTLRVPVKVGEGDLCWYNTYLKVESYTEPDRKAIEDEVWSMVKDIALNMTPDDYRAYFGVNDAESIFKHCGCLETIDKYEAWKKQKYEIHVGDEVEYEDCKFVVTAEIGGKYHGVHSSNGNVVRFGEGDYCKKDKCKKTGRHFDEVERLLKRMRGDSDE